MIKDRIVTILSLLIVIIPFTGFPLSWRNLFVVIFGGIIFILAIISLRIAKRNLKMNMERKEVITQTYAENQPISQNMDGIYNSDNIKQ